VSIKMQPDKRDEILHWIEDNPRTVQDMLIRMVERQPEHEGLSLVRRMRLYSRMTTKNDPLNMYTNARL
jgi:hypothetical protein